MDAIDIPVGQKLITTERYNSLTPYQQGYASYFQGEWNSNVPNGCPYNKDTQEYNEWNQGNFQAMLVVQDSEE